MSSTNYLFTIVIPTLNEGIVIHRLLSDLENQIFRDFQVVIVDGGSFDNTLSITKSFKKRIYLNIILSDTKNAGFQRNLGAKNAKGKYIVFLDADSQIDSDFLLSLNKNLVSKTDIAALYIKPDTSLFVDKIICRFYNFWINLTKNLDPAANATGLVIKRDIFIHIGGFDPNYTFGEDRELIRRIYNSGSKMKVFKSPVLTFSFRRFRENGYFKTFIKLTYLNLYAMFIGIPDAKQAKYKMGGGCILI